LHCRILGESYADCQFAAGRVKLSSHSHYYDTGSLALVAVPQYHRFINDKLAGVCTCVDSCSTGLLVASLTLLTNDDDDVTAVCLIWGYRGGSPTAVQAWQPCPLWEPSPSHPILV